MLTRKAVVLLLSLAMAAGGCGRDESDTARRGREGCRAPFDASRWRALQEVRGDAGPAAKERLALARRLVRCGELEEKERSTVERLLGPPSDSTRDSMEYYLAPEPGRYPLDAYWLFIDVDGERVSKYEVAQG